MMNQTYPYYYHQPYQQPAQPYYHYYPITPSQPQTSPTQSIQRQEANQLDLAEENMLPIEQSYIENILRLNRGKVATIYMTIAKEAKTFRGIIEAAGRDHIILSDPETGKRYLLLMVYLDYVVFDEEINYDYPF